MVFIGVKSGSIHESSRLNGGSHFNEHLLFKTNKHRGASEITRTVEWNGGYLNAFTEKLSMVFYIKALPEAIDKIIQIVFEAAANFEYTEKEFELERKVILTEIKNSINIPNEYAFKRLFTPVVFQNTLLEKTTLGTTKSMSEVTKDELQDFKIKCFSPKNMVAVAVGIFDEKNLTEKFESTFGKLNPQKITLPKLKVDLKNNHRACFEERKGIDQAYMNMGYKLTGFCKITLKENFALKMMAYILKGGMSSRLFTELREKRGIGYRISCFLSDYKEASLFGAGIDGFDHSRLNESIDVILGEFNKLKNESVPDREFKGIKNYVVSRYQENIIDTADRADKIWNNEIRNTPYDFRDYEKHLRAVTKKDVMDAAQKYLTSDYTLTSLVPEGFK